ncbi:hypothetical protein MRY82_10735, partial [bacterium]|nr:hypothetical protein [bacterium]
MKLKTHFLMLFVAFHMAAWAQDPPLPTGLGEESSPPSEEPQLPSGLDGNQAEKIKEKKYWKDQLPFTLNGFTETRGGLRLHNDPHQKDMSLAEARLHSEISKSWDRVSLNLASDFLYDAVIESDDFNLEDGQSWFDLREANLVLRPLSFLDLKLGRQILTWGTGDLLFINDLFPKDWNSFFIGRDLAYLKAPSDAIKASFFSPLANLDVVYTPQFDSDRYIDGQRISYFSQNQQSVVGRNDPVLVNQPNAWFEDDEWALRLYRQIKAHSVALYYYNGFWKSPSGFSL